MAEHPKKNRAGKDPWIPDGWGMVRKPNRLQQLLFRLFFDVRDLGPDCRARIKSSVQNHIPVYVAGHRQFFVFLFFNWVLFCLGFPPALFVNVLHVWFLQPIKAFWVFLKRGYRIGEAERLERVVRNGEPCFLFLKSPAGITSEKSPMGEEHLKRLIELEEGGELDQRLVLIPLMAVWGHHPVRPARSESTLGKIFGQPETPGRLRSLMQFFVFMRRMRVRVGEPFLLRDFLAEKPGMTPAVAARELRWEILGTVERQRNAILGPPRKGARRLRSELINSTRFKRKLDALAKETGRSHSSLMNEADKYLKEIAADIGPLTLRFMRTFMGLVFHKIFSRVEYPVELFEKLRAAGSKGPLIMLPSHKSHVDYLFVSWIVAANGVAPPLIAAGVNLSFWPVGPIFRRSGAFFLRRSFGGNPLYTEVFSEYLAKVLREGYNMEFFIEGGRSRTGKVLQPKMGLLKWIAEAAVSDRLETIQLVPMDISYEKVIEAGSYARELSEGNKKSERAGDLVKAGGVLGSRFGSISLRLGEPFPLVEALEESGLKLEANPDTGKYEKVDPAALSAAVSKVAHRVVFQISRLCTITPTSLLAAGLLCSGRHVVTRRFLLAACGVFAQRARAYGARFSKALEPKGAGSANPGFHTLETGTSDPGALFSIKAIDAAIELFAVDNLISIHLEPKRTLYRISDNSRTIMSYYRNSIVNHLAREFILAQAVLFLEKEPGELISFRSLRRTVLDLSRLLKKELAYEASVSFEVIFSETLEAMETWALEPAVGPSAGKEPGTEEMKEEESKEKESGNPGKNGESTFYRIDPKRRKHLVLLAGLGEDFLQAYRSAAGSLRILLEGPMGTKRLEKKMVETCLREFFMGEVSRRESCNRILFRNTIELWMDEDIVRSSPGRRSSGPPVALSEAWTDESKIMQMKKNIPRLDWNLLSRTLSDP